MSFPTGGAGGLAKSAGSGASSAGVAKASAAKAADAAAPAVGAAVNSAGKGAGNDMAQKAGFGPGGGADSVAPASANSGALASAGALAQGAATGGAAGLAKAGAVEGVKKMGAGGTSAAREPGESDGEVGKANSGSMGKAAVAAAAVPAAGAVGQMMFLMMFLNWLKSMFFAALAAVANLISMVIGVVLAVGKALVGGAMAMGTAVSSFVGGAVSAGTAAVASVTAGALAITVVLGAVVGGVSGNSTAQLDGSLADCSINVVAASLANTAPTAAGGDVAQSTDNAKLVYGVLSAWGMSDENIAGILGNWDAESGIDATGVETVTGEPFTVAQKKQAAESKGFDVNQVDPAYAARYPGVKLLGIGLGQWSNGRNTQLLDYAKSSGGSWSKLETQLGFMVATDSGAPVIKSMIAAPIGSPSGAAVYFHQNWERSADTSTALREAAADKWFAQLGGWSKNQSLADSILAQTGTSVAGATFNTVSTASNTQSGCQPGTTRAAAALTPGTLKPGGLTLAEAQALMVAYKSEGEAVLAQAFGGGGPGDCGFGKADNCVGFSNYFTYKFTSDQQYASGNGIDTAGSVARITNRQTSGTPTAYSVFSQENGTPAGHTGVILGIQGDQVIIGEASCGTNHAGTRAYARPITDVTAGGWTFTDVSDLILNKPA